MKKIIPALLLAAAGLGLTAACDKTPENGPLDGNWQLMEITRTADATPQDVKARKIFWAVQLRLINLKGGGTGHTYFSRFRQTSDSLILYHFYDHVEWTRDTLITDSTTRALNVYGIDGIDGRFAIEALDRRRMVLRSDYARLVFRKF